MNKHEFLYWVKIFLFWVKIWVVLGIILICFFCFVVEGCARTKASINYLTTGKIFEEVKNDR